MKRILFFIPIFLAANLQAQPVRISASLVRPAAVTTYTAGDVVNDSSGTFRPIKFANILPGAGLTGVIVNAFLTMDSLNVTNATFRLYVVNDTTLTDTTGIEVPADNAALTLLSGWRNNIAGYIDFTLVTAGSGSTMAIAVATSPNLYFTVGSSRNLYAILTATGAYVPATYGKVTIVLTIKQG